MTVIGKKRIEIKLSKYIDKELPEKAGFKLIEGNHEKRTPELQLFEVVDLSTNNEETESDK